MLCVLLLLLLRGANPVWFFFLCDITFASVFRKFSHYFCFISYHSSSFIHCAFLLFYFFLFVATLLVTIFLEVPFTIVQRADLTRLQPTWDAMEVEGVVANAPGNGALLAGGRCLIRLAFDAEVHDVVTANGAIVDNDIWIYAMENISFHIDN